MTQRPTVAPTGAALGADIENVDLAAPLDDAAFAVIRDAWRDHLVLRFRGQSLDDDRLAAFSARFGELDMAPITATGEPFNPARPEIAVISNVVEDGKAKGSLGNSELVWHQDMSYNDLPPKASLLYGIETPAAGGDTSFYNLYAAYETLPQSLKNRIAGLSCKHDATRNSAGQLRDTLVAALRVFRMPTDSVPCRICRWRLSRLTRSSSMTPIWPTPAAAR